MIELDYFEMKLIKSLLLEERIVLIFAKLFSNNPVKKSARVGLVESVLKKIEEEERSESNEWFEIKTW